MVRSREGGEELERFREEKIGIVARPVLTPSFLENDPDFDLANDVPSRPSFPLKTPRSPIEEISELASPTGKGDDESRSIVTPRSSKRV